ncbi:MFS general substrate transporter [Hyaloscypha bicolor E]|uniref:MFS general substrate transporter n=1 Tax=Hyaloscypha bicolor E TaxID=1095630 RepID=A0A2J6SRN0_9HELO|nr:MFS general substrate transporter [Hyaloscypha bicolor E]PMD53445.1 MFS general substrate transporter [Hyaloscypha bicolor E]
MTEKATPNAVQGVTTDVNLEKGDIAPASIHSNRHGDATKLNLDAYKSDDSDGKINWTITHRLAAFSLCLLYVGSQIPLYFIGASLSFVTEDIGGTDKAAWLPVANTLALGATAPFVGYMQDLIGRRYIALLGCLLLIVGVVIFGTAHEFGQAVTGMAISGKGGGIGELTALAGISEIVPVNKRGTYLAIATGCIIPFSGYILYAQYWSFYATWRWGMWITAIINGVAFAGTLLFYFPNNHHHDLIKSHIIKKIDFMGAVLSIVGLTLFAYVLSTLIIGFLLMVAFGLWEWKGAKYPIVPHEIFVAAFGGALSTISPDTPARAVAFGAIAGFGIGGVLVPAATIAITVTPDAFIATTVALSLSIRVIGGSIGYSIYYNIFANKLKSKLPPIVAAAVVKAGLPLTSVYSFIGTLVTNPKMLSEVPGVTPAVIEAATIATRWAYSESLKKKVNSN